MQPHFGILFFRAHRARTAFRAASCRSTLVERLCRASAALRANSCRWAFVNARLRAHAPAVLEDPDTYSTAEKAASAIYQKRDTAADRDSLVHSLAEATARGAEIYMDGVPEDARGRGRQ